MQENNKNIRLDIISAVIIFFLGLFLFAKFGPSIPISVNQITTNKTDLFSVSSEGKVTAVPDIAEINVGFSTTGNSVNQVQNQANSIINKITQDVKNLGVGEKDIKTSNYNIYPDWQNKKNYTINVNLHIKVRDFAKINSVIDTATTDGANQIGSLNFTVEDMEKFQSQARKIAIDNAKKKAGDLASAAGISLGKIVNVTEGSTVPRPMLLNAMEKSAVGGGVPTNLEPGSSEISATVTLSYETR